MNSFLEVSFPQTSGEPGVVAVASSLKGRYFYSQVIVGLTSCPETESLTYNLTSVWRNGGEKILALPTVPHLFGS